MPSEDSNDNAYGNELPFFLDVVVTFFGGTKPLSKTTVWRMVKAQKLKPPIPVNGGKRWTRPDCEEARDQMIAARHKSKRSPRLRKDIPEAVG